MSTTLTEFAMQLAAEAEKRGLRIIIEPITPKPEAPNTHVTNSAVETHETELVSLPTSNPESDSVKKITDRDKVREEKSQILVSQAARMLNIGVGSIYKGIKRGEIPCQKNARGWTTVSTDVLHGLPNHTHWSNTPVPVQCVETGKTFASFAEAGRYYGAGKGSISQAVSRNVGCKGLHFRKIESEI